MDIYDEMMALSRRIAASFPDPGFYEYCAAELADSRRIYRKAGLVCECREAVMRDLTGNRGHGMDHAEKVALEAGALVIVELKRMGPDSSGAEEMVTLAQVAGLLHDMRRGDKDHAGSGSVAAGLLLEGFGVSEGEKQCVVEAIANHEAFVEPPVGVSDAGKLVSDALYDADKFRWGPDNFTLTVWEMLRASRSSVAAVLPHFPEGMAAIARIRGTFRSRTGQAFGPEFIDLGLAMGERIYEALKGQFSRNEV